MVSIKTKKEIELMAKAGEIVYNTHQVLKKYLKPGITTIELDKIAEDFILESGAKPSFKGYQGFPNATCMSVNDTVVHGIPNNYALKDGDIVSIDIGAEYKGYHGDSAWSYIVGNGTKEKVDLLKHTEEALYAGLNAVKPGNRISDISRAVQEVADKYKLGIVKELVGHGVGSKLHEEPEIPNYVTSDKGIVLKEGMTLAIEPMLNLGSADIYLDENEWSIKTVDESPSGHFEHTVVVTKDGYKILTKKEEKNG